MRYMVLVMSNRENEENVKPTRESFEEMGKFNEGLAKDGMLLSCDGLAPTSEAARIRFDPEKRTVVDGPFAETKELVAGYWIVQAPSRNDVIERFKHVPFEHGEIEIRRLHESEDFADILTPEMKERWASRMVEAHKK